MILDSRNEFCNNTPLNTGAPNTFVIGNQIDLGTPRELGGDQALYLVILASVGINAAGAGQLTFQLVSADDAALTTNPVVHARSEPLTTSTTSGNAGGALAAGKRLFAIQLPLEDMNAYKRYLGIRQVSTSQAITAGAIDAFLTLDVANWKSYDAPFQL